MKALRIFMVVALLAVPLFATEALADFTADTVYTPFARVGATTTNQPIIGFTIPKVGDDTLKTLALKSYIERAFSVSLVKLWVETNGDSGWQDTDTHLKTFNTNGMRFETQDTIVIGSINRQIKAGADTFYITVDAKTDSVSANAYYYHERGLEVVIEPGYIHLGLSSGQVNTNRVNNSGYVGDATPYFTVFKLVFDTQGPPLSLMWCFAVDGCKTDTIDQLDSLCIRADTTAFVDAGDAIDGDITVDLSEFCLSSTFALKAGSYDVTHCFGEANEGWDSCVLIPDAEIADCPNCIDVDSGHVIYATAQDSAGNETTVPLYFDKPIDTCKPVIDSIQFFITYDANSDGIAAIGDSLAIVAWAMSNADFEIDSMVVNLSAYFPSQPSKQWQQLDDVLNNNRLFRKKFVLEEEPVEMAADSADNRITVWAWDNACNYDTAQQMLNAQVDLQKPSFVGCYYYWHWDVDTFACIGIGDSVWIGADLTGTDDLASLTCDLVEAGIDGPADQPLYDDGAAEHNDATADDAVYNLLWEAGEPPIEDGKDANNTAPPPIDADYSVLITAVDGAGNWDTCRTPQLNRTLDTRRPRWSNQEKMYITQKPGARIAIYWPTHDTDPTKSCNEKDAVFFYIYVDSGDGYGSTPFGATFDTEYKPDTNMWISEVLTDGKYYEFKIKQEDDCNNFSDFSKEMGAVADGTPPHVCIAVPDSGLTFGAPFLLKAVADSTSHDADSVCLWYRFRRDLTDPLLPVGPWERCQRDPCCCMMQPGDGYVFTDTVKCISGYTGWVEIITVACDYIGNCQDTTMGFDDACLVVDDDVFRPGHFLLYWDTLAPGVMVTEVDGFASPQTACGYDVWFDSLNWVIFDVEGAEEGELFEVEVRGPTNSTDYIIFHEDNQAMPCTVWFSVDGWDEGTENLYIYVKDYDNGTTGNTQVQICVPAPPPEHCIYISDPVEWQRIPCTGTSGAMCVSITAEKYPYEYCGGVTFTEAEFQWSPTGSAPWYKIEDVIGGGPWTYCWDNTDLVQDGDTIYFRVIARDEYYMADTSYMVKAFVDCEAPAVTMRLEDVYYSCSSEIPKVNCDPLIVKAEVLDTMVDIYSVGLFVKRHSDPDIWGYWNNVGGLAPAWSDNIWMYDWAQPCCVERAPFDGSGSQVNGGCMWPNDYWDIRLVVTDAAGNVMFDYDGDGYPDDSTFNSAVTFGVAMTVFMDDEAPQPAISMVADPFADPPIYNVNPSYLLGGSDKAYVQAGHDITAEISVLPSEDTCEVMKVEWFIDVCVVYDSCWRHVGTSTDPNHFPITFNPLTDGLLEPHELEDGWWYGWLKAVLYDSLGNSKEDIIDLFILDITPSQALIVTPLNDSYVYGDVQLSILALNAYQIQKVCYEFKAQGGDWQPINGGYPNACVTQDCVSPSDTTFALIWHTMNTVDDGVYYVRAVATDCDNNVDDDPPTIKVTVANGLPSVVLDDPRECERTCPDDTVDILGYIAGTVTLYATATSDIPVDRVEFMYKSIFGYPDTYTDIGTCYFVSGGKYSVKWSSGSLDDGRYHVKARVYNAAGRFADSDPITVTVDNSAPFTQIVSIMGNPNPNGMNITYGDVIDIELWAMDSTSDDGWTRCYNSGLVGIQVCIEDCVGGTEYTKCFAVDPAYDGFHTVQWNTSGLEFDGCSGCYKFFVEAWDCLGNVGQSSTVTVYVSDVTAPITTIGGFDGSYIYGYSSEKVSTLLFEYADSGSADWIPIGWSDYVGAYCNYLYKTSWDASGLDDGTYQIRVISHDTCSNQDDDMAPVAYFTMYAGHITPHNPEILGPLSFLKNWCVGGMHGVVLQSAQYNTPVVIARYGSSYECVDMQAHSEHSTEFAGSFYAYPITSGGQAKFFSSVTLATAEIELFTGDEPAYVTYLTTGTFDVVKVKCDLGTHGTYQDGCVEITIPDGAIDCSGPEAEYIWVSPTYMEWAPVTQPDILPIGDDNGYATYISFTDCYYCCGFASSYFSGQDATAAGAGATDGYGCCLNDGKYAKIKMCYDQTVDVDAEHLAVAWWDCANGQYSFDHIYYPVTVEGFDTENHTVEFATDCLRGPFVVVQLLERHCEGTIAVNILEVEPYCDGYTNAWPTFKALITDNVQGTGAIDQSSIRWSVDLFNAGELVRFYDGGQSGTCNKWMTGFGSIPGAGYNEVSGIFRAGFNDPTYYNKDYTCDGCVYQYYESGYDWYLCEPLYPLGAGSHMATVTAMNSNIQTCTDTMTFMVDATEPKMWFADYEGAYVTRNPHFCMYFTDTEAGVDRSSIWIDLFGDDYKNPSPNDHHYIATIMPDQLEWMDDTTVCLDLTFDNYEGGYLHVYVYGGPNWKCYNDCPNTQYYGYLGGVADCVGNRLDAFWRYYTVDAHGPKVIMNCGSSNGGTVSISISDSLSGVDWSSLEFYEDGLLLCEGLDCIDEESISLDTESGVLVYTSEDGGTSVEIRIRDNLGNLTVESCDIPVVEEDVLVLTDPHNYPNPFDPRIDGTTAIDPGLGKSSYLTVKIYDFAGEFVKELQKDEWTGSSTLLYWDGATDDGTEVANGTYLCYIHARDDAGATKTAVIKITVLKQDE